mgnify:CR=1 FL=1
MNTAVDIAATAIKDGGTFVKTQVELHGRPEINEWFPIWRFSVPCIQCGTPVRTSQYGTTAEAAVKRQLTAHVHCYPCQEDAESDEVQE